MKVWGLAVCPCESIARHVTCFSCRRSELISYECIGVARRAWSHLRSSHQEVFAQTQPPKIWHHRKKWAVLQNLSVLVRPKKLWSWGSASFTRKSYKSDPCLPQLVHEGYIRSFCGLHHGEVYESIRATKTQAVELKEMVKWKAHWNRLRSSERARFSSSVCCFTGCNELLNSLTAKPQNTRQTETLLCLRSRLFAYGIATDMLMIL